MKRSACLVIAALVATAGCGGSGSSRLSKAAYESKLRAAFDNASTEIRAENGAAGSRELLTRIAGAYGGIASSLKDEHPPADVQALNDGLVAGAAKQSAALRALVARLATASKPTRDRLLAQFDPSTISGQQEFDRAVAGLRARGYRISPSAGT